MIAAKAKENGIDTAASSTAVAIVIMAAFNHWLRPPVKADSIISTIESRTREPIKTIARQHGKARKRKRRRSLN
jgi:hypothetical protein